MLGVQMWFLCGSSSESGLGILTCEARPRLFVDPFPSPPASPPAFGGDEAPVFVLLYDFLPGVSCIILIGKTPSFSSTIVAILFYECLFPESSFLFVCIKAYHVELKRRVDEQGLPALMSALLEASPKHHPWINHLLPSFIWPALYKHPKGRILDGRTNLHPPKYLL